MSTDDGSHYGFMPSITKLADNVLPQLHFVVVTWLRDLCDGESTREVNNRALKS